MRQHPPGSRSPVGCARTGRRAWTESRGGSGSTDPQSRLAASPLSSTELATSAIHKNAASLDAPAVHGRNAATCGEELSLGTLARERTPRRSSFEDGSRGRSGRPSRAGGGRRRARPTAGSSLSAFTRENHASECFEPLGVPLPASPIAERTRSPIENVGSRWKDSTCPEEIRSRPQDSAVFLAPIAARSSPPCEQRLRKCFGPADLSGSNRPAIGRDERRAVSRSSPTSIRIFPSGPPRPRSRVRARFGSRESWGLLGAGRRPRVASATATRHRHPGSAVPLGGALPRDLVPIRTLPRAPTARRSRTAASPSAPGAPSARNRTRARSPRPTRARASSR